VFFAKIRIIVLFAAMTLVHVAVSRADPIIIQFTARVGTSNSIDAADIFNEGYGANLAGQIIAGSVTIDPTPLTALCGSGGACYADFGAGAISVSFTLNGVTSTIVSTGTLGYFGNRSGGSLLVNSPGNGGDNYLAAGATSPDGMVQESIGALFVNATLFDASFGPTVAVSSLATIGGGTGLVAGGITYMNPMEHLDATILGIDVPEPGGITMFGMALMMLVAARRTLTG
jgi:hypothetical protein